MQISVIGCGYLGAVHAACMAELGHDVVGIDVDAAKVASLSRGVAPFHEPGFDELLARNVASGRLRFSTDFADLAHAQVHFIGVGTPQVQGGYAADLTYVNSAIASLVPHLNHHVDGPTLVVGKSTVPVGTAAQIAETLAPTGALLVWNPEFLREGFAVQDTISPDRIVYGLPKDPEQAGTAQGVLDDVYKQLIAAEIPRLTTDYATAELVKVAANSFLATKISFINAMAEVSDATGADVVGLADILGDDTRIGRRFLDAGIGFGGGCLPKDIRAFSARATEVGAPSVAALLAEVDAINLRMRQRVVDLATELCGGSVQGRRVAVLGASFKPLSDDVRDSPALSIACELHLLGAELRVYDPQANNNARKVLPALRYVASADAALSGADLVLHLTDWPEFSQIDPPHAGSLVRTKRIIDGRNKLDPERWRQAGWTFHGVGRGTRPVHVPSGDLVPLGA